MTTPFIEGFSDELEKTALVAGVAKSIAKLIGRAGKWVVKKPWRRGLLPAWLIGSGVEGIQAAKGPGRRILASSRGPSRAWGSNYSRAIGAKKKLSKLEQQQLSRYLAKYRERA